MRDESIEWRAIPGYEGLYEVSENADIWRVERVHAHKGKPRKLPGKALSCQVDRGGYTRVTLFKGDSKATMFVHRAVAMAFIPNPEGYEYVNHKSGVKSNNHVSNLEWVTFQQNMRHAFDNGLFKPRHGDKNNCAVLADDDVKCIFYLLVEDTLTNAAIGRLYGVGRHTINLIAAGKTWRHLERPYHPKLKPIVPASSLRYVPGMERHSA